jgi:subtilisin family serine protease
MGEVNLYVLSPDEKALRARACVGYRSWDGEESVFHIITNDGDIAFDGSEVDDLNYVLAIAPGYWASYSEDVEDMMEIVCHPLPAAGRPGWWHDVLGSMLSAPERGAGIRIGVVDMDFEPTGGLEHVTMVTPPGSELPPPPDPYGLPHGEEVCRILGDRDAPPSCAAIAGGAELFFSSGSFGRASRSDDDFMPPPGEDEATAELDPAAVASAIVSLAADYEVDIINLSLGTFDLESVAGSGLLEAIRGARSIGTLVVAAVGGPDVAVPARWEECVGVGAFGDADWGAPGSLTAYFAKVTEGDEARRGTWLGREIYHWPESAYGDGLDMIAPGVGITVCRDGRPAFDLSGTSFAAPIVTGLLAVALAEDDHYLGLERDGRRSDFAERALQGLCASATLELKYEGRGIASLP